MEQLLAGWGDVRPSAIAVEALGWFATESFDLVLTGMNAGGMAGVEFLNEVWKLRPRVPRFIVASAADRDLVARCAAGTHQFVAKPADAASVQSAIAQQAALEALLDNSRIRALAARVRSFPPLPSLYLQVMKELSSPDASAERVGEIIARDLAITTKIIQVVNSACFGFARQIASPTEAVVLLGLETIRSLVLSIQAFSQFDQVKPLYFSIDRVWKHSVAVAATAKRIALLETADEREAETAYTAGLLHDVGKLVLALNLDNQYNGALGLAKKQNLPPCEVEERIFGTTHADAGAYLVAQWGLPPAIVQAIAGHHRPGATGQTQFSALTALHVANVFEHERAADKDGFVEPLLDMAYLEALGLHERVAAWRRDVTESDGAPAVARPARPVPAPEGSGATPTGPVLRPDPPPWWWVQLRRWVLRPWVWAGIEVVAVLIAGIAWWAHQDAKTLLPPLAAAATARGSAPSPTVPSLASPIPNAMAATSLVTASRAAAAIQAQAAATSGPVPDAGHPASAQAPATPDAVASAAGAVLEMKSAVGAQDSRLKPVFKLQGIFYQPSRPSALINGRTFYPGDTIDDSKIVEITRQSVTLEVGGQRRVINFGR
jgi:putative nucleotidyltransferase with HDIG domain